MAETNDPGRDEIVVVGGGPAGALLSYVLASRGLPVTLIERHSDFSREFRGEGLSPGGIQMFAEVGLQEAFDAVPHTVFSRAKMHYKGKQFTEFDFDWKDRQAPRFVSQPGMLEMLVAQAQRFENFHFLRGYRVTAPLMRGDRVSGVKLSGSDGDFELPARYVFACDGRFSLLRKAVGLHQDRNPEFFDIVWCKVPMPAFDADQPPTVRGFIGDGHLGLFIPSYDGLLQIGWVIPKGSYRNFREMGIDGWMQEMARHVTPAMAEHLLDSRGTATHPFLLDVVCDCYATWSVPGLTLVGDAAHPMSPVGAQGINIALRDVIVAANHFVPLLRDHAEGAALDAAALVFEAERRKEVEPIQAMQRRAPRIVLSKGLHLDILFALIGLLSRIGLSGLLGKLGARQRRMFLDGATDVHLEV